jgi:hypothetical protein
MSPYREAPAPKELPDGATRVFIRAVPSKLVIAVLLTAGLITCFAAVTCLVEARDGEGLVLGLLFTAISLPCLHRMLWHFFGGDLFLISRSAFVVKRRLAVWHPKIRELTADVSTVVVSGEGEAAKLVLQLGRRTQELCKGLSLDDARLRAAAQSIRKALDQVRSR